MVIRSDSSEGLYHIMSTVMAEHQSPDCMIHRKFRIDGDYLPGCEDTPYTRRLGRKACIRLALFATSPDFLFVAKQYEGHSQSEIRSRSTFRQLMNYLKEESMTSP
jgi:hypothetical protein